MRVLFFSSHPAFRCFCKLPLIALTLLHVSFAQLQLQQGKEPEPEQPKPNQLENSNSSNAVPFFHFVTDLYHNHHLYPLSNKLTTPAPPASSSPPPPECAPPSRFPQGIRVQLSEFRNWAENIVVPNIWVAYPNSTDQIVTLVNWARRFRIKIRASGRRHSWSPITITPVTAPHSYHIFDFLHFPKEHSNEEFLKSTNTTNYEPHETDGIHDVQVPNYGPYSPVDHNRHNHNHKHHSDGMEVEDSHDDEHEIHKEHEAEAREGLEEQNSLKTNKTKGGNKSNESKESDEDESDESDELDEFEEQEYAEGEERGMSSHCNQSQPWLLLVKTNVSLVSMKMVDTYDFPVVSAQSGVTMENLLNFLHQEGYTINSVPAIGDVTLGGVLAVGGHGSGVPAKGENNSDLLYGTVSNLVVNFTAVVWDARIREYAIRSFNRSHPHAKAFLTNLGRTFLLEVTLRVTPDIKLRCVSRTDIPATELFGDPAIASLTESNRTLSSFIEASGRVESILFPFTENPWLKIWSISPIQERVSRRVTKPYNYPFSDILPAILNNLVSDLTVGNWQVTPTFGQLNYKAVVAGLTLSFAYDLWGSAKDLNLYIRPSTLRYSESGFAILTKRESIQRVLFETYTFYSALLKAYQSKGKFPINGPFVIRVGGLDLAEELGVKDAEAPALSPVKPFGRKEWDVCIWVNILTFPQTPDQFEFLQKIEGWMISNYHGDYALLRPEWSKAFAYTTDGAWENRTVLNDWIPRVFNLSEWRQTMSILRFYDPYYIYTNRFLDALFH